MSVIKVIIVRHGDAVSADIDPQRPLSRHGTEEISRLADALSVDGVSVSQVLHSGKVRAAQTAEILAQRIAPGTDVTQTSGLSPNDDPSHIAKSLAAATANTLVAGHMPSVGRLTRTLCPDAPAAAVNFWTGSAVCLERTDTGDWMLAKVYDSREL